MKKHFTRIFLSTISFFFPVFFLSCSDNDEPETEHPLFTFQVSEDYLHEGVTRWLMISRANGEALFASPVTNGQTITVPMSEHLENERYIITDIFYSMNQNDIHASHSYHLNSYAEVAAGTYTLDNNSVPRSAVGVYKLTINNNPGPFYWQGWFGDDILSTSGSFITNGTSYSVTLGRQPVDLVYCAFPEDPESPPFYTRIKNAMAGETESLDFSALKPMENKKVISLPGVSFSGYSILGIVEPGNYANMEYLYSDSRNSERLSPESLPIWYPDELYQEIMTTINYGKDGSGFGYTFVGSEPPSSIQELNADIISLNVEGDKLTMKATGNFDYATVSTNGVKSDANNNSFFYSWTINLPGKTENKFTVPEFHEELTEALTELKTLPFEFREGNIYEYNALNGYDDFVTKRLVLNEELYKTSKHILARSERF